jgi:hypothetical protein
VPGGVRSVRLSSPLRTWPQLRRGNARRTGSTFHPASDAGGIGAVVTLRCIGGKVAQRSHSRVICDTKRLCSPPEGPLPRAAQYGEAVSEGNGRGTMYVLALALFLGGCAAVQPTRSIEVLASGSLTKDQISTVYDEIRSVLKEPPSARFGKMAAVRSKGGTITVCGWVSARGYTGERPFMGRLVGSGGKDAFELLSGLEDESTADEATATACRQSGVPLP